MLRRTIKETKGKIQFVVVYTREPHARQLAFKDIKQPVNWKERCELAEKTKKELKLDTLFLIDDMGDPSRKLFGDVPNPAIFIEKKGKIKDKLAWADGQEIRKTIEGWLPKALPKKKAKPVSRPASQPTSKPKKPTSK